MNRPEVICHMVSTIDGKIAGQSFAAGGLGPYLEFYVETKQKFGAQATAYGASTAKEIFLGKDKETFEGSTAVTDESDYIFGEDAPYFVVVVDPLGEIPWKSGKPEGRAGLEGARIIVITSSRASKEYLDLLREKGIAYLISRGSEFRLTEPMEKLKSIRNTADFAARRRTRERNVCQRKTHRQTELGPHSFRRQLEFCADNF